MIKTEVRVIAGMEDIYDMLIQKKKELEECIRKEFEERSKVIDITIENITETIDVEYPDDNTCEETLENNTENGTI